VTGSHNVHIDVAGLAGRSSQLFSGRFSRKFVLDKTRSLSCNTSAHNLCAPPGYTNNLAMYSNYKTRSNDAVSKGQAQVPERMNAACGCAVYGSHESQTCTNVTHLQQPLWLAVVMGEHTSSIVQPTATM
jgi:hypothetical protein